MTKIVFLYFFLLDWRVVVSLMNVYLNRNFFHFFSYSPLLWSNWIQSVTVRNEEEHMSEQKSSMWKRQVDRMLSVKVSECRVGCLRCESVHWWLRYLVGVAGRECCKNGSMSIVFFFFFSRRTRFYWRSFLPPFPDNSTYRRSFCFLISLGVSYFDCCGFICVIGGGVVEFKAQWPWYSVAGYDCKSSLTVGLKPNDRDICFKIWRSLGFEFHCSYHDQ